MSARALNPTAAGGAGGVQNKNNDHGYGYGTLTSSSSYSQNNTPNQVEDAVLPGGSGGAAGKSSGKRSWDWRYWRHRVWAEIDTTHVDVPLLATCFCAGLTDSTVYNAFSTFVSMQTGNTIFIALGASGQNSKPYGWVRSLTSLLSFICGSFFFSRIVNKLGARRRFTLLLSYLLQSCFVVIAASLAQAGVIDGSVPQPPNPEGTPRWNELGPIALLSFQGAAQIVVSRGVGLNEVPTLVLTSLLCDLFSDPGLAAPLSANAKRNRRVIAFVLTLLGAIAGGWISKETGGIMCALWLVAAGKFVVAVCWVWFPAL
ncbi:DUF1275 domain protein [Phyllosticta citriasiana]|uniref:DUF1275 domain protein n=1 Tax=Phyllosticta citriasiana TaxID=595635 RepID=A0ABR1KZG8_9PEZI